MKEDGFLAMVHCAMLQVGKEIGGFAFVDDMDLCVSRSRLVSHIAEIMQQLVSHWEGLLCATGGALIPEKCFWYLLNITWDMGNGITNCQVPLLLT